MLNKYILIRMEQALCDGDVESVRELLRNGADPNQIIESHLDILDRKSRTTMTMKTSSPAIIYLVNDCNLEIETFSAILKEFVKYGVDLNTVWHGYTALMNVIETKENVMQEMAHELVASGASLYLSLLLWGMQPNPSKLNVSSTNLTLVSVMETILNNHCLHSLHYVKLSKILLEVFEFFTDKDKIEVLPYFTELYSRAPQCHYNSQEQLIAQSILVDGRITLELLSAAQSFDRVKAETVNMCCRMLLAENEYNMPQTLRNRILSTLSLCENI